jgi:putative hydrolase of HD superfamily
MENRSDYNAAAILALYQRLLNLKMLPRTGWLQRGQANPESIADHTFGVTALALIVGDQLPDLDRGRLLSIALLHDIAEAMIGDLPMGARRFFGIEVKRQAEERALIEMLSDLPQAEEYLALWTDYAERGSREARLVKQLDRLEMLAQALAYERAGNVAMAEFWEDIYDGWSDEFPVVQSLASQMMYERERAYQKLS